MQSSGAVTGGRTRHDRGGLLGRSAEIAEIENRLVGLERRLSEIADKGQALGPQIQELSAQIQARDTAEGTLRRELSGLGVLIARQSTELDSLVERSRNLYTQRDELCARRDALEDQRKEAAARADTMASDDEVMQHEIAEAQEAASRARQALSVCASELADLRVRQAGIAQRIQEIDRDVEREQARRQEALDEAQRRREAIAARQEERKRLEEAIRLHLERSRALSENKEQARSKVIDAENQRQTLLDESETVEKQLREVREQARDAQSRLHEAELALRQREDRVGYFQERILEAYNVALASLRAEEVGTDEYSPEERDKLVTDVRSRLQRLGEVNLMAIEEYETLENARPSTTQYKDLQSARETARRHCPQRPKIRHVHGDLHPRRGPFRNYFRTMFNGGQARIYLLDEDDRSKADETKRGPRAKTPEHLAPLRRTGMTALALLFAIFRAKPTPSHPHEVDAPLDDGIRRFLSMWTTSPTRASLWSSRTTNRPWRAETPSRRHDAGTRRLQIVSVRFKDGGNRRFRRVLPDSDAPCAQASRVPGREYPSHDLYNRTSLPDLAERARASSSPINNHSHHTSQPNVGLFGQHPALGFRL